ncbi:uncharacterized protein BKCO1_5800069 [Diplodia corticola]|uniref:Uncharacterized protein n=1 Tax=Diplodia corticola TaxID=236234 RepID=A0A1J9RQ42_9PEZI|nr:uncharacterized protein BKCO1_5800069 [Diplodia corticola]OJD30575.1 hypothetical protein BKCO1_5800069 [Diplodia corticola]
MASTAADQTLGAPVKREPSPIILSDIPETATAEGGCDNPYRLDDEHRSPQPHGPKDQDQQQPVEPEVQDTPSS